MKHALLSTLFVIAITMPAQSGVIERACLTADRSAASPRLCGCIQQRKAARFFSDPHEAQEVRQSSRQSDRRFWDRYRAFGAAAETYCG
jgi:hypothetical protein